MQLSKTSLVRYAPGRRRLHHIINSALRRRLAVLLGMVAASGYAEDLLLERVTEATTATYVLGACGAGAQGAGSSVGASGAVEYRFPMGDVTAVYSSDQGWSIGGGSVIERSSKWGVPTYTANDLFMLDGEEMAVYMGFYHTSRENYLRIRQQNAGGADSWWQVEAQDGTVSKYGITADSRIEGIGKAATQPRAWAISEARNVLRGTLVKYVYEEDAATGSFYLSKIISGKIGAASANGFASTTLTYEEKPASECGWNYRPGCAVKNHKRATWVTRRIGCDSNGNGGSAVEAFKIDWVQSALMGRSLVKAITPYGADLVKQLPSTRFEYPTLAEMTLGYEATGRDWPNAGGDPYIERIWSGLDTEPCMNRLTALMDINGDHLPDKVWCDSSARMWVRRNTGAGFEANDQEWQNARAWLRKQYVPREKSNNETISKMTGFQIPTRREGNGCDIAGVAASYYKNCYAYSKTHQDMMDLNGDGLPDQIFQDYTTAYIRRNNGTSGFQAEEWWGPGNMMCWNVIRQTQWSDYRDVPGTIYIDMLDINGDGLPDKVADANDGVIYVSFNTRTGFRDWEVWAGGQSDPLFQKALRKTVFQKVTTCLTGGYESCSGGRAFVATKRYGVFVADGQLTIADINGDGLQDKVACEAGKTWVSLNTGRGFADRIEWVNGSPGGFSHTESTEATLDERDQYFRDGRLPNQDYEDITLREFLDINGDGLPDQVWADNSTIRARINTGTGFLPEMAWGITPVNALRKSSVQIRSTTNIGRDDRVYFDMADMNGDGVLDLVHQNGGGMSVYLGRALWPSDMALKRVTNSLGGAVEYSYKPADRTMGVVYPLNRWVVNAVTAKDGLGGVESTSYQFSDPAFSASTKEDRGFGRVVQIDPAGNKTETFYCQDDVLAGLVQKQIVRDADGNMYSYVYNTYEDFEHRPNHWGNGITNARPLAGPAVYVKAPKLVQQDTYLIDGQMLADQGRQPSGSDYKRLKTCYDYAIYGQPLVVENFGEVDALSGNDVLADKVRVEFGNLVNASSWAFAPEYKRVKGTDGQSADYTRTVTEYYRYSCYPDLDLGWVDSGYLATPPYLKAVYEEYSGQRIYKARYGYDAYGNVTTIVDGNGNCIWTSFDTRYRSFPVARTNASGMDYYATRTTEAYEYDGLMRATGVKDANGVWTRTGYDVFGRPTNVIAHGDSPSFPTVLMTYNDFAFPSSSVVTQRQYANSSATLASYTYRDGLGRTIQTKTQGVDTDGAVKWRTVDVWDYYSGNKRMSEQSAPYFSSSAAYSPRRRGEFTNQSFLAAGCGAVSLSYNPNGTFSGTYSFPLRTEHVNEKEYGYAEEFDGLGRVKEVKSYSDESFDTVYRRDAFQYETARGNVLKVVEDADGAQIVHSAQYDAFGRLISAVDPNSGSTSYTYDPNGNMLSLTDPKGKTIYYTYGPLDRLMKVMYPDGTSISNVYDRYVGEVASGFSTGRLTRVVDSSGSTSFRYDGRGRIVSEVKFIQGSAAKTNAYVYDSMDRIARMVYPDGSVVSNTYDGNGYIKSVGSSADKTRYLMTNTYNALGQIVLHKLGNKAQDVYEYYTAVQGNYRLKTAQTRQQNNTLIRGNSYNYDAVGNISELNASTPDVNYSQAYSYDPQNRLLAQTCSTYIGGQLTYSYDALDNIRSKTTDGALITYTYDPARPHAVAGTSDHWVYGYDANGNMNCREQSVGAPPPPPPPSSALIARWTFDEGSGASVLDVSGNGHHGTIQGGAAWTAGHPGSALRFDGVDDFVAVANAAGIPAGNEPYTIEAWIKPESMGARGIIGWGRFDQAGQMNSVRLTDWGLLNSWFANDLWVSAPGLLGNWHHVAAVYDGTTRSVYLDGVCIGADAPGQHTATAENLVLGRDCFTSYFHGTIDELSVWRGARTPGEVARDSESILNPSGLAALWSFNENGGTVVHDSSGNGNHGTVNGGTIDGGVLLLDGVDDFVSVANLTGIPEGNQPYTIGASIQPMEMGARGIVGWGVYGPNNGANALRLTDAGVVNYWWGNDLTAEAVSPGTVTATYDGKTRSIYVNGVLVGSDTPTVAHAVMPQGFTIGRTCVSEYFKGALNGVAIWRRALSADEVYRSWAEVNQPALGARWTFDEGSGTTLHDASGNGNHGAISGATWVKGKQGNALYFDGINDVVSMAAMTGIPTNDETFSITAWIKPETMHEGGIVGWGNFTNLGKATGLKLSVGGLIDTWGVDDLDVPTSTLIGRWHHVAVTFDGVTRTHTIYLDGAPIAYEIPSTTHNAQSTNLKIGRTTTRLGVNEFFKGAIDEVAVWRGVLSAEEVFYQYQQLNKNLPDLAARWKFDEGSGTTVADSSGNGNNGTISGATWAPGAVRNGLRFDGVDDFVNVPICSALPDGDCPYTVEAWIKPESAAGSHYVVMWGQPRFNRMNSLCYIDNVGSGQLMDSWGSSMYLFADTADLAGGWHHILSTYDGTNVSLFVDGNLAARDLAFTSRRSYCLNLMLGRKGDAIDGYFNYFKGTIDELCIWRKAMNDDEAKRRCAATTATSYTYDHEDRLVNIESPSFIGSYVYDFSGRRVKKTESGIVTYYFSPLYEIENGTAIKYYYADGELVAQDKGGTLTYYHSDHLNSISRVTDAAGNEIRRMEYLPYGQTNVSSGSGAEPKYAYTGQEKDSSGLYYYGARFYDPELGRFLTLDPLGDDYCYALNNPIMFNDPSGMQSLFAGDYQVRDSYSAGTFATAESSQFDRAQLNSMLQGCKPLPMEFKSGGFSQIPGWAQSKSGGFSPSPEWAQSKSGGFSTSPEWAQSKSGGFTPLPEEWRRLIQAPWTKERGVGVIGQVKEYGRIGSDYDLAVDFTGWRRQEIYDEMARLSREHRTRGGKKWQVEYAMLINRAGRLVARPGYGRGYGGPEEDGCPMSVVIQDGEKCILHTHLGSVAPSIDDVYTITGHGFKRFHIVLWENGFGRRYNTGKLFKAHWATGAMQKYMKKKAENP
ncbi:MAG TPA: hypothetical protein DCZ95_12200 [Verrucomicrobia bacterium]|nr:MAG: hypothetical protein A2X46_14250 [Lentisphaerae bacterium GWF2_57_35]HBA84847.1 hypothetical protein [Verrucomicrobiota bacterium]